MLIHLRLSDAKFGTEQEIEQLQKSELAMEAVIAEAGAGMLDGNEIGQGEYVIFTYGPDAVACSR